MSYYGNVPPPASLTSKHSTQFSRAEEERRLENAEKERKYNELVQAQKTKDPLKKLEADNAYFDDDSDEEEPSKSRQRPTSSSGNGRQKQKDMDEEDEDELDAFMAGIDRQAQQEVKESKAKEEHVATTSDFSGGQAGRDDIEEEDMHESLIKFMEDYKERHEREEEEEAELYEYDEEGNIKWTWKKEIDPLPPIDHSAISYPPFQKDFYVEHEEIRQLTPQQVFELRIVLDIRVYGREPPRPVVSFGHFQFDKPMMALIRKAEYEKPTPIQAQAVPAALSGRDVLGLAKTGSGKTLAYIWPAIVHIMHQPELQPGDGPIVLFVVPTRELALQVYNEARRYAAPYNIGTVCAYGGGSKYEQRKALEEGAELVIGTPGRIIDLVKEGATNFLRTTFLVFDEVDRMFDLGFEPQVKSLADHIRPDRQCLVFSATCKQRIEKLVMHALYDPVKVLCGDIGEANTDVQQTILVLPSLQAKYDWLFMNIVKFITMGKVLIFVTKKIESEDVAKKLKQRDIDVVLLHGDMHQQERNDKITAFRTKKAVMVATDVAARGLDIAEIRNVVNFTVPRDVDTHVHRVGRTGRAGNQGFAYTLLTADKDTDFAAHLVKNLESSDQPQSIGPELLAVAQQCPWFSAGLKEKGTGAAGARHAFGTPAGRGGGGFKPKERPGFGLRQMPQVGAVQPGVQQQQPSALTSMAQPSITKQVERAKALAGTGNVAGMSKMQMMRSALKGTFQHSFQASSANEFEQRIAASDPRPEWKIRLDEQAAKINRALQADQQQQQPEQAEEGDEPQAKRRSRWGQQQQKP